MQILPIPVDFDWTRKKSTKGLYVRNKIEGQNLAGSRQNLDPSDLGIGLMKLLFKLSGGSQSGFSL